MHAHPFVRYFITGAPLWGLGDNATFLHRATVDYRAKPYVRLSAPRWQRLARRHLAITLPLVLAMGWPWVGHWPLATYLAMATLAMMWWAVATVATWLATRRATREWVDPAGRVLFTLIGGRWTRRAGRAAIDLPRGWGKDAGDRERPAVRVHIPPQTALSPQLKQKITANVGARLGIPAPVQGDWREAGTQVSVDLMGAPLPPKEVTFEGLRKAIEEAADHEVILGRKAQGHVVKASLVEDSPHFIMSGAAGTGKSGLARLFMVQRALRGDGLIMLDPKRFSHWRWAGGGRLSKDQVIYAYRDEDLHDTWVAIGEEIGRRIELPEDDLEHQRRVIILVEEANVQIKKLTRYWRGLRKEIMLAAKQAQADDAPFEVADLDPPLQSPAVVAMQESVCMGRELKMHVVVAAQRASAGIFGGSGGDIRESFQGGRLLARWDRKLWKMLVDTVDYVACPSKERGVWGLATATDFEVFRVPWLAEKEALAMLANAVASGPVLGGQWPREEVATGHVAKALPSGVTLANAVGQLPGRTDGQAVTLAALRKASGRPGFPEPLAKADGMPYGNTETRLYDLDELIAWCRRSS